MHLYETHLLVKDSEVSSGFYVDVVGLEYAHRDLTRDVVFLWIGSKKRSMLGLWGPTTPWGQISSLSLCCRSSLVRPACRRLTPEQPRRRYARFFGEDYNGTIGHRLDAIGADLLFRPGRTYR